MSNLIIIRGPSGSGKSTIASFLRQEDFGDLRVSSHETDHFFGMGSSYKFDPKKLGQAHKWCQDQVRERLMRAYDRVIVSNTSMSLWELNPYFELGREYGYHVTVIRTPGPWDVDVLHARNVHGVPLETLRRQIDKYEPVDGEQEWTNMSIFDHAKP